MVMVEMSQELIETLEHAGVKGMKWGKRKAQPTGTPAERRAVRREASISRGQARLDRSGGSATKANLKTAGKVLAFNVATNLAGTAVRGIAGPGSPASVGFTTVATLAQLGVLAVGIREVTDTNRANNS